MLVLVMPLVGAQGLLLAGGHRPGLGHCLVYQVREGRTALDQGVQGLLHTRIVKIDPGGR